MRVPGSRRSAPIIPLAVLGRVLHDPPGLDGCPPGLRGLIERCLAKDPARRPAPGGIIDACRAMAGGGLSFERPWLPAAVYAATAAAVTPEPPRRARTPGAPRAARHRVDVRQPDRCCPGRGPVTWPPLTRALPAPSVTPAN